ncbi:MAG: hypothetical protein LBB30_01700 [Candidatus Methanoplasma sp.]|jgi:hypothetical protein|nr:hypothetical protein [Candidatus Methanoplasma sp.]
MFRRRSLPFLIGLFALVGVLAVTSFSDGPADAAPLANGFDLAVALDNAESGDTVTLYEDSVLSRDAGIKSGVTLDDGGFSLRIPAYVTLSIEGVFFSSGNLTIDSLGSAAVASGGLMRIENNGNTAEVAGSLEVYQGGTASVGQGSGGSTIECFGTGKLLVEGTMTVGSNILNSAVIVRNATVTGELRVSEGSSFRIHDSLAIGNPPALTSETVNPAVVSGKLTLEGTAYVIVYGQPPAGQPGFTTSNINPSVSTQFMALGKAYATEYKASTGSRTLVLPSTSSLKDYRLVNWMDSAGNVIAADSSVQIGADGHKIVYGELVKKEYRIVFSEDKSIRWSVGPTVIGSHGETKGVYGAQYTISIRSAQGYTELPAIFMDGAPFAPGTSFTVTGDTIFTTSNNYPVPDEGLVPILVIILAIMLVILGISYTMLRMKEKKKAD